MVQGPLMEASGRYPQTDAIAAAVRLPRLPPTRLHAGVGVALLALASTALALRRTVWGFEVRAVGVNARAARIAGIAVESRLLSAFLLSGAIAGLAGGIEVIGVTYRLYERFSPGYGFTGIAVALLGRLQPAGVLLAGVFFGILETGSNAMERSAGVSSVLVSVIQAAIIMSLIALEGRRWFSRAANASGNDAAPETRTSPHGSSEARR
jgi:simple sugar transport system permease protein